MTVEQLVARDVQQAPLKPATRRMRLSTLATQFGLIGRFDVETISRLDVERWQREQARTPYAARQALHMLSAALDRAGLANPTRGVRKRTLPGRRRFLSDEEYRRLGAALAESPARALIMLIALTGCRESEIRTAEWRDVRGDALHIRDSKTGPRMVWLSPAARRVLRGVPRGTPLIFESTRGQLWSAWKRITVRAGLDGLRLHDLRHSYASLAMRSGEPVPVIGRLMGHRSSETTMGYMHSDPAEAQAAVAAVAEVVG